METFYKCGFCPSTSSDSIEIIEHERLCLFNPENKGCPTCNNYYEDGYEYAIDNCAKRFKIHNNIRLNCVRWEAKK